MQARRYVEAPAASPLPFGLLSVAVVESDTDSHLGLGVQYETLACGGTHLTVDQCIAALDTQPGWTSDEGKDLVVADAFTLYALHQCRLVGAAATSRDDALSRLANGFGRGVEQGTEQAALLTADDLTPTPGTAIHPVAGLAILEKYAGTNYSSRPVIHMTRDVGTLLTHLGAVDRYSSRLETKQGALVASGGGYGVTLDLGDPESPDQTAGDGEAWLRVTGTIVVRSGRRDVSDTVLRKATAQDEADTDAVEGEYLNEFQTFAQQPVVATIECINAAVLVQTPATVYAAGADGGAP